MDLFALLELILLDTEGRALSHHASNAIVVKAASGYYTATAELAAFPAAGHLHRGAHPDARSR